MKKTKKRRSLSILLFLLTFIIGFLLGNFYQRLPIRVPHERRETINLAPEKGFLIFSPEEKLKVKVWYVIDGDTFALSENEHVRLLGIEAEPLSTQKGFKAQMELKRLIENEEVELEFDPNFPIRDKYGRLLCYVFKNGKMVNLILLKKELAEVNKAFLEKSSKYKELFKRVKK